MTNPKPNITATRGPEERWGGIYWKKELFKEEEEAKLSGPKRGIP